MTTFVLVPGAGGDAWYWHRLVPLLEAAGNEAVAVDLPAAADDAGLAAYTDAVAAAVGDRTDLVLVGQSMGGLTAPLVADRLGRARVRLLVLLNAMTPRPGETGGQWWEATGQEAAAAEAARREGRPVGFDPERDFFHDVPAEVHAEALRRGEPPQSGRPFADPWPLSAWPAVATRVLQGVDDRLFPFAFQQRVVGERLGVPVEPIPGGHLVALARPDALADRLLVLVGEHGTEGIHERPPGEYVVRHRREPQ